MTTVDDAPGVAQEDEGRAALVSDLRRIADLFEAHPELPVPFQPHLWTYPVSDDPLAEMAAFARAVGRSDKGDWGEMLRLRARDFTAVELTIATLHENVCERVVVGTTTVEEPDPDAVAALPRVRRVVEQVEWRCPQSILRADSESSFRGADADARDALADDGAYGALDSDDEGTA
jgi:hypothetical protein